MTELDARQDADSERPRCLRAAVRRRRDHLPPCAEHAGDWGIYSQEFEPPPCERTQMTGATHKVDV